MKRDINFSKEAFVPLVHMPGEEAEVDWYEGYVDFSNERKNIYFFQMRACCSGKEFHMAFLTLGKKFFCS